MLRDARFDRFILAGPQEATTEVREHLPHEVARRLVATIPAETFATDAEILRMTLEIERRVERESEEAIVTAVIDASNSNGPGACGMSSALEAVWLRQVRTLVVADGLGASGCLALDRTARPDGWKAIRGAMGSTFRVPIAVAPLTTALERARARRLAVFATVAAGGLPIEDADLASPCMVLLGNEGAGLPDVEDATRVTIAMAPGVESINVAVAAALILYEARRQRKDRR